VVKLQLPRPHWFRCHLRRLKSDYSGDEDDFGDKPALPNISKFSHISEEEIQVDVLAMVPPSGEVTTTQGISSIPLFFFHLNIILTLA